MFVRLERIPRFLKDTTDIEPFERVKWDNMVVTESVYLQAKTALAVPFDEAEYLLYLFEKKSIVLDTFPLTEKGYSQLPLWWLVWRENMLILKPRSCNVTNKGKKSG